MKRVATWTTFDGATAAQIREALSRSPGERLEMIQRIREAHWGLFGGAPTECNELLRLLRHHGVHFVLAVGLHGRERSAKDLDLLVDPSDAKCLGKALVESGDSVDRFLVG